ncbi:hypothetical protein ACFL96_06485, partial [Thermoproteota archaeon]
MAPEGKSELKEGKKDEEPEEKKREPEKETKELFERFGFKKMDEVEFTRGQSPVPVPYPQPSKMFKLIYQSYQQSIEEIYFWILTHMREDWGLHNVEKIHDIFTASEQSSFWGASQQRLQIQQQQVSQYMGTIGQMVKALFQLVREIRINKEKLHAYKQADEGDETAEVVLKGYWVDLKDGGAKNPTSVYGMATQVGFAILPDLFFSAPIMKDSSEVPKYVKKLSTEFNRKVCEVLGRKLKAYMLWRENTHKELSVREKFSIKYLRQHYDSIQMYMSWVKPYLMNIKRLQMNQQKSLSVDLIGAFEGSIIEIEVMCHRATTKTHNAVVLATFEHRTRPSMDYHTEGYQHKGPIHVGRVEMTLRTYAWTPEQIENYKKLREEESMELLSSMDEGVKATMESLGEEMKDYLREAGEKFPEDLKKE